MLFVILFHRGSAKADIHYEIPLQAITEAIVNDCVHRDYNIAGAVQVMLFQDRLEVWNPGRLPLGMNINKLSGEHSSIPTNPLLARPVYLAGYIEQLGTGTSDIVKNCIEQGLRKPEYLQDENFTAVLWRPAASNQVAGQVTGQVTGQVERLVLAMDRQTLSRQEIMDALSLKGRDNFRQKYLIPAMEQQIVLPLYPLEPNRPDQKYYLTEKGLHLFELLKNK